MKKVIAAVITGGLFIAEIVLLKRFDVAAIGPNGTEVGFSHLNKAVHDLTGVNMLWYEITDLIGYAAIAVCALFAVIGLVQLIKRRSLFKVDREILALGGLFVAVIGFYVFFEKFIINYRPVVMPGETAPEASFPSSHTMLIITVMVAVILIIDEYVGSIVLSGLIKAVCTIAILVTVGGRLYCGVHWFTDIVGGILLSVTLLLLFAAVIAGGGRAYSAGGTAADDEGFNFVYDDNSGAGSRAAASQSRSRIPEKDKVIDGYRCKH